MHCAQLTTSGRAIDRRLDWNEPRPVEPLRGRQRAPAAIRDDTDIVHSTAPFTPTSAALQPLLCTDYLDFGRGVRGPSDDVSAMPVSVQLFAATEKSAKQDGFARLR